jgi:7-cyano-7-deazaguanine synthase in queuosine biosynthesis
MQEFYVVDTLPCPGDGFGLVPGRNLVTGSAELADQLGTTLTSLEEDLLTLAAAIFSADLAAKRQERELFVRDIRIDIPLVNHQLFVGYAEEIAGVLYLLSSDNWKVNILPKPGEHEQPRTWPVSDGTTLLFSGGLDSLSGAIELLEDNPDAALLLASHYTRNHVTVTSQNKLFDYLRGAFGARVTRVAVRAGGQTSGDCPFPKDAAREVTQRTRSFLFLVIAAIATRRRGFHELLLMAENGQMAIHLPLTAARLGAFSTRTAHPEFLDEMEALLSAILSYQFSIRNPFVYRTKAECIARPVSSHLEAVTASVSCWSSARHSVAHCGACTPCLVRRIALEAQNVRLPEYQRDLFAEDVSHLPEDDEGKRNFVDLAELVIRFNAPDSNAEMQDKFPDLRNAHIDADQAIEMYRRFSQEALSVFANYPNLKAVL